MNKNILTGVVFVGLGASIYGMLATFVKLAYTDGYTTEEVTSAQFAIGLVTLLLLNILQSFTAKKILPKPAKKEVRSLLLAGTSLGCTSLFYYLAVQYINVSVGIVLLMQSVWFSVVVEAFVAKKIPNIRKILAVVIVLAGTVLATNLINSEINIDPKGIFWGLLAAASFTLTMFTSNRIAIHLPVFRKSFIMLCGGAAVVFLFLFFAQIGPLYFENLRNFYHNFTDNSGSIRPYNFSILWKYGIILALFGTVIPPILFNKGFPKAGLGLGSIVSSLELPVSVTMAYLVLDEKVMPIQWFGIALILFAVIIMNISPKSKKLH